MLKRIAVAILVLLPALGAAALGAPSPATEAGVRAAAEKGLAFLTTQGTAWKTERKCASCHHLPYTIWALNEAKKSGYAVDEKTLAEMTDWVSAPDDRARAVPVFPAKAEKPVHQNALLLAVALEAGEPREGASREALSRFRSVLRADQRPDGSWGLPPNGRPPMIGDPVQVTAWTLLAFTASPGPSGEEPADKEAAARGLAFLAAGRPDEDLQLAALRLLLLRRRGAPRDEIRPRVKSLVERQNADGGWSQAKELASDAYATGQALYALAEAGGASKETIRRAQAFLLSTQLPDGSWPMLSRSTPGGAPAKDARPIAFAGSGWAALGLVRSMPGPGKSRRSD
jgi:hypothetical protein